MSKRIVHLLSGGLDSVTMLYDFKQAGYQIHCLMFDYRQRHKQELLFAKHHASRIGINYTVMDLPDLGGLSEQSWVVPNRNAIFISCGVNLAAQMGYQFVTIGCNSDDAELFPDCKRGFIDAMNAAAWLAGYEIKVWAPYIDRPKSWIGGIARELGISSSEIWTCYKGGQFPCGECHACKKLKISMP